MKYYLIFNIILLKLKNNSCVFRKGKVLFVVAFISVMFILIPVFVVKSVHHIPYNIHVVYMVYMWIHAIAKCNVLRVYLYVGVGSKL